MTPAVGAIGVVLRRRPWWRHPVDLLIAWGSRSAAVHAFVVVDGGRIVQAQPHGAELAPVDAWPDAIYSTWPLTPAQREAVVAGAMALVGTPYNWWDDVALGLVRRFGTHVPRAVRARLADPSHLQCAQLADLDYQRAGIALFADGRLTGDVTPGDLLALIRADTAAVP